MAGEGRITFTLPFGLGAKAPKAPKAPKEEEPKAEEAKPKTEIRYNNEFTEIYYEFVNDLALFRDKYPLTSLVTMVFFAFLGISSFFSFNFTSLISCVLYCATSYALAKSIGSKGTTFWSDIKNSLFEIFQASSRKPTEKPDTEKS